MAKAKSGILVLILLVPSILITSSEVVGEVAVNTSADDQESTSLDELNLADYGEDVVDLGPPYTQRPPLSELEWLQGSVKSIGSKNTSAPSIVSMVDDYVYFEETATEYVYGLSVGTSMTNYLKILESWRMWGP